MSYTYRTLNSIKFLDYPEIYNITDLFLKIFISNFYIFLIYKLSMLLLILLPII